TARAACAAAGVPIDDPGTARLYLHALGQLAASRMIEETS
ncbi:mycofactocin biosynthesis chaperone MftB, partial [Dietzia sp. CW19]|nr:mycofactocin biosynthesis chaperone MftB [Dietzia sp. CW19]MBB1057543.1 mycofactocin biosynthesis chaperone MftB [Dietzia sp. B19]